MTLDKAIEILQINILEAGRKMPPDVQKALELGINAMKRIGHQRHNLTGLPQPALPDEEIV